MAVTCLARERELIFTITGEVDHHAAREIIRELERQVSGRTPGVLTVDLAGVTFMDSSGIAVVLRAYQRMRALGGRVTVRGAPRQAKKVLSAAGLERMIEFV